MPTRPSNAILPTAFVHAGECFLVSRDGAPVWPLADEEDAAALERIATICGARLSHTEAFPRRRECPSSRECVAALGDEVEDEARLYAHLTGRVIRCVSEAEALVSRRRPAVLVTTQERLTPELLSWLYDGRNAPGIVCGESGVALRRQVLVRTAAAVLVSTVPGNARALFPTSAFPFLVEGRLELAGRSASASVRRHMLATGSGVLAVMTHSDGIDAFLGPDLTACGLLGRAEPSGSTAAPRCAITGWCHRHNRSVREAFASDAVSKPEIMAAQILVWDVCFGVLPAGSLIDPRPSIGRSLIASASVGALVTNWQIVVSSPDATLQLLREIATGAPVGEVVGRLNRSIPHPARSHPMCLFGDPRTRLVAPTESRVLEGRVSNRSRPGRRDSSGPLEQLRMVVASADGSNSDATADALRAIEALDSCVVAGLSIEQLPRARRAEMREAVLHYAMSRGKLLDAWLPHAHRLDQLAHGRCPACGRETDQFEATFSRTAIAVRRLVLCAICGLIEDAPKSSQLCFTLAGRTLTLHGKLSVRERTIGILIASPYPADTIRLAWQLDENGVERPSTSLPETLPVGLLRLSVIVVEDTNATILSRMIRDSATAFEAVGAGDPYAAPRSRLATSEIATTPPAAHLDMFTRNGDFPHN